MRRMIVRPREVRKGDRIYRAAEYLGTVMEDAHDISGRAEDVMWKAYLDGGSIGRWFMPSDEMQTIERPLDPPTPRA